MFTKLIGIEKTNINGADYEIRYYRNTNLNRNTSFSCEVNIAPSDKVILDERSMARFKYKVGFILPAALYTRRLGLSDNRRRTSSEPSTGSSSLSSSKRTNFL